MESNGALQDLLRSFERYYDVRTDGVTPPFAAEAEFHVHDEQYVLVRAAKIAESDAHEFVFFAAEERLTAARLAELSRAAWAAGLSRVSPHFGQRNCDVSLVLLADSVDDGAFRAVKKIHRSKSYALSLKGWSDLCVAARDVRSGRVACNRRGAALARILSGL